MTRLLSWNVNGLRAALRRGNWTLSAFLDSLEAEVICFQETKITRSEFLLDREACLADGWESFFSCTRGKTGYSGVATFCKAGHAIPAEAQEGLTGLLQPPGSKESPVAAAAHAELIHSGYDAEELLALDVEGRCVVTDHGQFVLFNLYAPALSSAERMEERFAYKLDLFKVLFMRMEALRAKGRRVVLVGDFNIAPAAMDSCDPGTGGDLTAWTNRRDRVLLNSYLQPKGAYCDIFRVYHPDRSEAYTCWNQASGARVNNYGTRIDLILVADACCPDSTSATRAFWECWTASDIQPERQGSDHAPVWAELDASMVLPSAAAPPALASRFLFNATKQSTLASWLVGKGPACGSAALSCSSPADHASDNANLGNDSAGGSGVVPLQQDAEQRPDHGGSAQQCTSTPADVFRDKPSSVTLQSSQHSRVTGSKRAAGSLSGGTKARVSGSKHSKPQQSSMRSFFATREASPAVDAAPAAQSGSHEAKQAGAGANICLSDPASFRTAQESELLAEPQQSSGISTQAVEPSGNSAGATETSHGSGSVSRVAAAAAWQSIQQKMKPPKCKGHKENCLIQKVKKNGPNKGRLFYVCARPDGPKPHGRCDHFQWVGDRKVRDRQAEAVS